MKRERAKAARVNTTAMRVAGVEEGKGSKSMAVATRLVGKWMVTSITMTMVTKMKEESEERGEWQGQQEQWRWQGRG
jgi:hypothetical protein